MLLTRPWYTVDRFLCCYWRKRRSMNAYMNGRMDTSTKTGPEPAQWCKMVASFQISKKKNKMMKTTTWNPLMQSRHWFPLRHRPFDPQRSPEHQPIIFHNRMLVYSHLPDHECSHGTLLWNLLLLASLAVISQPRRVTTYANKGHNVQLEQLHVQHGAAILDWI